MKATAYDTAKRCIMQSQVSDMCLGKDTRETTEPNVNFPNPC